MDKLLRKLKLFTHDDHDAQRFTSDEKTSSLKCYHFCLTDEEHLRALSLFETNNDLMTRIKSRGNAHDLRIIYHNHLTIIKDFFTSIVQRHVKIIRNEFISIELHEILTWLYVDDTFCSRQTDGWYDQLVELNRILDLLCADINDNIVLDAK